MKSMIWTVALVLAVVVFGASCGDDADPVVSASQTDETSETSETNETDAQAETVQRLWIAPELVDCVGVAPQKCMVVRTAEDAQPEWFYDQIEGFEHVVGTSYVIDVAVTELENPPADASSLRYRLVEVVESKEVEMSSDLDGTSWTLLGFRDGDLFDPIGDATTATINFDGDRVSGGAGCNNYMGTFEASGNGVTFGPLGATRKLCGPDEMAVEDRFLPIMATIETAEITADDRLVLAPGSGMGLVFARS